jgi:hypothetical protein
VRKGSALLVVVFFLASGGCSTFGKSGGVSPPAPEAVLCQAPVETCAKAVQETLRDLGDEFTRGAEGFLTEKRERDAMKDMEVRVATYRTFVRKSISLKPVEGGGTEVRVEVEVYKKDYLLNAESREDDPGLAGEVRGEFFEALGKRLSPGEKPRRLRPEGPLSI